MEKQKLKFYPVGNGDTALATLSGEQHLMVDCKIDNDAAENKDKFDVKKDLLAILPKDTQGRHHLDAFILTHPDQDHCVGFKDTFFCDDPERYDANAIERKAIIIDELWFSDTLFDRFDSPLSEAANNFKKEAQRRKNLYISNPSKAQSAGNRLVLIDFLENVDNSALRTVTVEPGSSTSLINGTRKTDFSIFVHGPFKTPTPDSQDRNETSVIMQLRFGVGTDGMASLAFLAGDADYNRFKRLLDERDDESIEWDLLLAPHHCSWTYFNMTPQAEYPTPQESSLEFLDRQRGSGFIVASSKKIEDDDDNPPHYAAKKEYCKKTNSGDFFNTGEKPLECLEFAVTASGFKKLEKPGLSVAAAGLSSVTDRPKTYGKVFG